MKFKITSVENKESEETFTYTSLNQMYSQYPIHIIDEMKFHFHFFPWFESPEELTFKAYSDFSHKILLRNFYKPLGKPHKKNALEIGFGSGRLMNPACKFFNHVYGIDIHNNFGATKRYLGKNGNKNYTLIHRNQAESQLKENTIDFFYSYATFELFDEIHEIDYYMTRLKRWLKPGGTGIAYFKRLNVIFPDKHTQLEDGTTQLDYQEWKIHFLADNLSDQVLLVHPLFLKRKFEEWGYNILEISLMPINLSSGHEDDGSQLFYIAFENI